MSAITIFAFEDHMVRTVLVEGEPWFVATDLAAILDYRDAANMSRVLDDDEKGTHNMSTLGGSQSVTIISEPGLYRVIANSRSPRAKPFQRWLFHEALPTIRKTGGYHLAPLTAGTMPGAPAAPANSGRPMLQGDPGNLRPIIPGHAADIFVAADRLFRSLVRSGTAAGMSQSHALASANQIALDQTGIDMLRALKMRRDGTFYDPVVDKFADWAKAQPDGELKGFHAFAGSLQDLGMVKDFNDFLARVKPTMYQLNISPIVDRADTYGKNYKYHYFV